MTVRRIGPLALLLASLLCGIGCGRSSTDARDASTAGAGSRPAIRMAVGGQAQLVYLPATLAQALGYYRDEGLDVTIDDFAGGAKALEALVGGSADVVCGFYDHTIQLAVSGRSLTAFVTMLRYPGLVLAVAPKPSRPITRVEDLKGARIGITAPGSSSQMLVEYLLHAHGLSANDVSFVGIGTSATAVAAMEHSQVDAGILAEPARTEVERRAGGLTLLGDFASAAGIQSAFGTDSYPAGVLYASSDWLTANPETARHLARAIVRTLDWMHQHTARDIADRMPARFRGGDDALYVAALNRTLPIFSTDGLMPSGGARAVATLLAFALPKVREAHVDLARTYTNQFVPGAR
jgi:NitT/TauT family transport system substrate-binding protein